MAATMMLTMTPVTAMTTDALPSRLACAGCDLALLLAITAFAHKHYVVLVIMTTMIPI